MGICQNLVALPVSEHTKQKRINVPSSRIAQLTHKNNAGKDGIDPLQSLFPESQAMDSAQFEVQTHHRFLSFFSVTNCFRQVVLFGVPALPH